MQHITIHDFDSTTGIYLGTRTVSRPDGVGLPANSTTLAPHAQLPAGHVQVWNGSEWEFAEDHQSESGELHREHPSAAATHSEQHAEAEDHAADSPAPLSPAHPATGLASGITNFKAANTPLMDAETSNSAAAYSEQRTQSDVCITDNIAPTPTPGCLDAARRFEKDALAQRLLAKAALYKQMSGLILDQQHIIVSDTALSEAEQIAALEQLDATIGQLKQSTGI